MTISRLSAQLGLGDLSGRRSLEIGAGGGSIATWLATRTGPGGRVLATDINIRHLRADAGYEVLRHDLVEEPVPEGPWDLIHARLVLLHLPERREILHRLVGALIDTYHRLLVNSVLPAHGNDPTWAGQVHEVMLGEGLTEVDTVVFARSWPGGSAGARLIAANVAQARAGFLAAGMSAEQLDTLERLTADPRLVVRTPLTYSTSGRRP
jgi:Methyltransferase domain